MIRLDQKNCLVVNRPMGVTGWIEVMHLKNYSAQRHRLENDIIQTLESL